MTFFYNTGISAYNLAIRLAAPFNEKAKLLNKGRKEVWEKIRTIQRGNQRLVWFHAASLGEFEQGRPVIEKLKQTEPDTKILLTFFSPSGYEIIQKQITFFIYLPIQNEMQSGLLKPSGRMLQYSLNTNFGFIICMNSATGRFPSI